jgi:two-component system chemotaxis response regulator CheB
VGLAASTGGPSTLATLFENLGVVKNAAFLIVLHGQEWMLKTFAKSLQSRTTMPVILGKDGLNIEPGKIYIAPGERHMIIKDNSTELTLTDDEPVNYVKPSADPLFKSIAFSFGDKSIGIVLTGMGHDGSVGAGYISAAGGKIMAQDPQDAILSSMPESVIKLKLADIIAPIEMIAGRLINELK